MIVVVISIISPRSRFTGQPKPHADVKEPEQSIKPTTVSLQDEMIGQKRNKRDELWNARFKELLDYRSEHGDCNVLQSQGQLGKWVNNQRTAYKADSLGHDRVDRLSSIGFKWALKEAVPTMPWEIRYHELVQNKAKHGDCNIPAKQGQLGSWVHKQRQIYKKGKLSQDRIDRLNGIGFKWLLKNVGPNVPWKTRFDELVRYRAKHGDCNIPVRQGQLGRWVSYQRKVYKSSSLEQERIDRLNGIGFDWTPPKGNTGKRKASNGTESDDEVDEIGALIYDQVMRQRRQEDG